MIRTVRVNGKTETVSVDPDTPLLWVLRDALHMTGTKYGCGKGLCGACTVQVAGTAVRSCQLKLGSLDDKDIVTIEGIQARHPDLVALWADHNVPQCGYCQAGQLVAAASLLEQNPHPSDADIDKAMVGNICRCGTYSRIRKAIHKTAEGRS